MQSSSPSSGKRGCCKVGRNKFSLVFVVTVPYRRRGHIYRQNEWVSEWVSDSNNRIPILIRFLPDVHCATCSLFRSTIGDGKHLTIIFRMTHEKQSFSLQKYLIRCDWRILKTYRKTFFFEGGVFYCVNQRIMPSRSEDTFFFHFLPLHYKRW